MRIVWDVGLVCNSNGQEASVAQISLLQRHFWFLWASFIRFLSVSLREGALSKYLQMDRAKVITCCKSWSVSFSVFTPRTAILRLFFLPPTREHVSMSSASFSKLSTELFNPWLIEWVFARILQAVLSSRRICGGKDGSSVGFLAFYSLPNLFFTESASRISLPFALLHWLNLFATADHWLAPTGSTSCTISSIASKSAVE